MLGVPLLALALPARPPHAAEMPGAEPSAAPAPVTAAPAPTAPATAAPLPAAPAPEDPHAGLPKVLARAVKALEEECRAEGGTPEWAARHIFSVVNLSPDGRPDYLIDTHGITCEGGVTPWIGSDGFRYILYVSTGPGRWTKAFERAARGLDINADKRPKLILFSHSAYCTRPNPERYMRCTQVYEWRRGKLHKLSEDWFTG